jgi:hemoglobin
MDFSISQFKFGQRPPVNLPSPDFFVKLTEEGICKLVSDHYNLLIKSEIKHLLTRIDEALDKAKQRSSDFFIQICGGHPYSTENREVSQGLLKAMFLTPLHLKPIQFG